MKLFQNWQIKILAFIIWAKVCNINGHPEIMVLLSGFIYTIQQLHRKQKLERKTKQENKIVSSD